MLFGAGMTEKLDHYFLGILIGLLINHLIIIFKMLGERNDLTEMLCVLLS
jgi:hypothetical protein